MNPNQQSEKENPTIKASGGDQNRQSGYGEQQKHSQQGGQQGQGQQSPARNRPNEDEEDDNRQNMPGKQGR
jgi:hypothetical protein